jgi:hypothetical protein
VSKCVSRAQSSNVTPNKIIVSESSASRQRKRSDQPAQTNSHRYGAAAQRHLTTVQATWTHSQSAFTQQCSLHTSPNLKTAPSAGGRSPGMAGWKIR